VLLTSDLCAFESAVGNDDLVAIQDLDQLLPIVLEPGESVIWSGGPDPKVIFAPQDVLAVPFSIFFLSIATVVFLGALIAGAPAGFVAAVGVLVGLAIYLAVGRFFYKRYDRRRTAYVITDRRALAIRQNGADVRSVSIGDRPSHVELRADGTHGSMRWGGLGPAESPRELVSMQRRTGWLAGTYWSRGDDLATVSFWDVADFNGLKQAQASATGRTVD